MYLRWPKEHDRLPPIGITPSMIKISEHFVIKDGRAKPIWVTYYEPKALMELIAQNASLDQAA